MRAVQVPRANGPFELVERDLPEPGRGEARVAGITTYDALRRSGAVAGDLVAVLGIGGFGHLGVQLARHMGFRTVAIARGRDKEALARKLGAHAYPAARRRLSRRS
jgi:D-arabinose 1-dehydrogenase-like Zn-dependent alcohol dehydrogenase